MIRRLRPRAPLAATAALGLCALVAACGGGGGGGGGTGVPNEPPPPNDPECVSGETYASTFEGIQKQIFEKHGCTQQVCHGSSAQGGLDLSPAVAYANLFEADSLSSAFPRVYPGDKSRSFLWLKLAAKTDPSQLPSGVTVGGAPMPNSATTLSLDELELVRQWIYAGAPETGTVIGTEKLLDACLPDPKPLVIKPLDPPAPGEGVQLVMPRWKLPANNEYEICFASYYDISAQVPEQYRDPSGQYFRFRGQELRQDPQSHHLILNLAVVSPEGLHDPAFGSWTCKGGARDGQACEPTDLASCGEGLCGSDFQHGFACTGFGPSTGTINSFRIGGAQQAQANTEYHPGVFGQIPLKGVLYWNSHAFNLTDTDSFMNARINYYFAEPEEQVAPIQTIFNASRIFSANAMPFTTQTICADHVMPRGSRLFQMSSHTHKHGKHFTVDGPDGARIYDSKVYNDPVDQKFEPALTFDAPDARQRTLRYCSLYNNGLNDDGTLDVELVTRASRVPESARRTLGACRPIACVAGKVGAACNGENDDRACDSSPGANDGDCDACRITGGESTENEMFILLGEYFLASQAGVSATQPGGISAAESTNGRSDFVGIAVSGGMGCASSHAGHVSHAVQGDPEAAAEHGHAAHDHAAHGG